MTSLLPSTRPAPQVEMGRIYRQFFEFLRDHAARLVDDENAEDVVHAALVKFYERLQDASKEPVREVRALLYRMVMDSAHDYRRRLKIESRVLALVTGPTAAVRRWMTSHRRQEDDEITQQIDAVLERLRPSWRESFLLVRRQGLKVQEAAEALDITPSTVRAHLVRATRALKEELTRVGMTPARVRQRRAHR